MKLKHEQRRLANVAAGAGVLHFALLVSNHPPKSAIKLVCQDLPGEMRDGRFHPFRQLTAPDVGLGYLEVESAVAFKHDAPYQTWRGRKGQKPPEPLWVAGALPEQAGAWSSTKWRGFFAAAERALTAFNLPGTDNIQLYSWLAFQFALSGFTRKAGLDRLALAKVPALGPSVIPVGSLLIWDEYLARQVKALEEQVNAQRRRNPFFTTLTREMVLAALYLDEQVLAESILRSLADTSGFKVHKSIFGLMAVMPPLKDGVNREAEITLGREMLKRVSQDELYDAYLLRTAYPSHLHVVQWLLSAEEIVDCGGYLFLRGEIIKAVRELSAHHRDITEAGVRELKDRFGYSRRKAESFRAFLLARLKSHAQPSRKGQRDD